MERPKIIEMIETGKIPQGSDLAEVKQLSRKYPYCSSFKVLLALASKQVDDLELREAINMASIYVQDRSRLYDLVVRDTLRSRLEEETESPLTSGEPMAKKQEEESEGSEDTTHQQDRDADSEIEEREGVKKDENQVIKTDLLEDQIMAEAVMHLGELEMDTQLKEKAEAGTDEESDVSRSELTSFGGWLLELDKSKSARPERELIDRFISEDRRINPVKKAFFSPSQMGKMSLMEDDSFVTETLAKIYERQGDYKKAARAYKNLSLKYPEKRVYFAALQKKAEEKI